MKYTIVAFADCPGCRGDGSIWEDVAGDGHGFQQQDCDVCLNRLPADYDEYNDTYEIVPCDFPDYPPTDEVRTYC